MYLEIIFTSLLVVSLSGMSFILFRKMPVLAKLPETYLPKISVSSAIKKGMKKIPVAKNIDYELYLQKMLSKVRVMTLKTESKTGSWLEGLRKRRNGQSHNSEYWEELRKAKKGK